MDLDIKRKERKALNSSLYSSTHRNARTIKLVSLRVRRIRVVFFFCLKLIYTNEFVFRQTNLRLLTDEKTPAAGGR